MSHLSDELLHGDVRLSVGIEHPDDIIADLRQAMETARVGLHDRQALKSA